MYLNVAYIDCVIGSGEWFNQIQAIISKKPKEIKDENSLKEGYIVICDARGASKGHRRYCVLNPEHLEYVFMAGDHNERLLLNLHFCEYRPQVLQGKV